MATLYDPADFEDFKPRMQPPLPPPRAAPRALQSNPPNANPYQLTRYGSHQQPAHIQAPPSMQYAKQGVPIAAYMGPASDAPSQEYAPAYLSSAQHAPSRYSQPHHPRSAAYYVNDDDDDDAPAEGSRIVAIVVCLFASLGGVFFGYDQGVTGSVLVMKSFLTDYCVGYKDLTMAMCQLPSTQLPDAWLSFTMQYNMVYNVGCMVGALLGGVIADRFGRRGTIFAAAFFFCVGTTGLCLSPAQSHTQLLLSRVVQGMGVGNSSFSLPIFGAEVSPKELRGFLSGFMQMMIVTGILFANIMNVVFENHEHGWRMSNAGAVFAPAIVMLGIFFVPESPRWVYLHKGMNAAEAVLKRLRRTENVSRELRAIGNQTARDGGLESEWADLLSPAILVRVLIAMFLQVLQQATGINPVFLYGPLIFKDVVHSATMSIFFLSIVNFVSTIPAMRWVDTFGRRQLLLLGAVGMVIGHLVSAVTFMLGCQGDTEVTKCNKFAGDLIVAATAFFVFNFAISWGPVCWIYPAEIFPLGVRAKAVSLSTMSNWCMGAVMSYVVKGFPSLGISGVFFLFSVLCVGCGTFVYFFCPETKGILLEDIEQLFHRSTVIKYDNSYDYSDAQTSADRVD